MARVLPLDLVRGCLESRLRGRVPRWVLDEVRERGWRSLAWYWLKRRLAEAIVDCLDGVCGVRAAYLVEMHGGEHVLEEMGDKDVDLVVDCERGQVEELNRVVEKAAADVLTRLLGGDAYRVLGVPNIVELRSPSDYLGSRLLSASYARPLRIR